MDIQVVSKLFSQKCYSKLIDEYLPNSRFISLVKTLTIGIDETKYMCTFFILTDNAGLLFKKIVVIHILPKMPISHWICIKFLNFCLSTNWVFIIICVWSSVIFLKNFCIVIVELFVSLSLDGLYYQFERALTWLKVYLSTDTHGT